MAHFDKQLQEFHDVWMDVARLYQLRDKGESLSGSLSVSQFYALAALVDGDGAMTMSDFAKALNLSFAGVNRMIQGLVRKGMVKKSVSKVDARAQIVTLTSKGRKHFRELDHEFSKVASAALKGIDKDDRAIVISAIRSMVDALTVWRQTHTLNQSSGDN